MTDDELRKGSTTNHHTAVVATKRLDWSFWPWEESIAAGAFAINEAGTQIGFGCPCGCGVLRVLDIGEQKPEARPSWSWDGNRDTPTLSPSVRFVGDCKWHGFLQAGVFTPCGDSGQ